MIMMKKIEPAGSLLEDSTFNFLFANFEKSYETYYGVFASVSYYLKVTIDGYNGSKIIQTKDFAVILPPPLELENDEETTPIKIEVLKSLNFKIILFLK